MFKTGILLDSLRLPLDDALRIAAESGADGIQMFAVPHEMAALKLNFKEAAALKEKINRYGLKIASLCGDMGGHGFERREENKVKVSKFKGIVDFAYELGTTVITTHIGVVSESDTEKRLIMQDALHKVCRYAEKSGILIAIETGPERSEVLRRFIEETAEESLKVNFDPANLVMVQGENPVVAVKVLAPYIIHTHANDGRMYKKCDPVVIYNAFAEGNPGNIDIDSYFAELPLGSGDVNFPEYLKALNSISYSGYLTIEREAGERRKEDIIKGVKFLQGVTG